MKGTKLKIRLLMFLLIGVFITSTSLVHAADTTSSDGFVYDNSQAEITIKDYLGSSKDIVIPNEINGKKVIAIGNSAFKDKKIKSLKIGSNVKSIDKYAFSSNYIKTLEIPSNVTELGFSSFSSSISLKTLKIGSGIQTIPPYAFTYSLLKTLEIPPTVKEIEYSAFAYSELEELVLHEGLESIGFDAFDAYLSMRDSKIRELTIPSTLKSVSHSPFKLHPLEKVTFKGSLSSKNVQYLLANSRTSSWYRDESKTVEFKLGVDSVEKDTILYSNISGASYEVKFLNWDGSTLTSKNYKYGEAFEVPSTSLLSGGPAFYRWDRQDEINDKYGVLEDLVIRPMYEAQDANFKYAVNDKEAMITEYIGSSKSITIPKSYDSKPIISIGSNAFNNKNIENLTFDEPSNIKIIGAYAFTGNKIATINLPSTLEVLGNGAFVSNKIENIILPESLKTVQGTYNFGSNPLATIKFDGALDKKNVGRVISGYGLYSDVLKENQFRFQDVPAGTIIYTGNYDGHFKVEFKDHDGSELVPAQAVAKGAAAVAPPNPTRAGYTFTSWDIGFSNVIKNLVVRAQYKQDDKKNYIVRFIDHDGNIISTQNVAEGKSAVKPEDPTRNYHVFIKWDSDFSNIKSDLDIKAVYELVKYKVEFENWNGDILKVEYVARGASATPPTAPARTGHVFIEWRTNYYGSYTEVKSDMHYTAYYEPLSSGFHIVSFLDYKGNLIGAVQTVTHGAAAVQPAVETTTRSGFTFLGWDDDFSNVVSDMTIKPLYSKNSTSDESTSSGSSSGGSSSSGSSSSGSSSSGSSSSGSSSSGSSSSGSSSSGSSSSGSSSSGIDKKPASSEKIPVEQKYIDVSKTDWFYSAISYMYENELMNGMSENEFKPSSSISRAMIVTILHRAEKMPKANITKYIDVTDNAWYTESVYWASENNIVTGYGNGRFGPDDNLTREQLVTILYRYMKLKGIDVEVTESTNLSKFVDASEISDYSLEAMKWAVSKSIISGTSENTLSAKASTTRAEVATMLKRAGIK